MSDIAMEQEAAVHALAFDEAAAGREGERLPLQANPLHGLKVQLLVRVGEVELTVGQLLAARENAVLPLDRLLDEPVDLLLEGQVVARGELVAVGDCFGVRVTELPRPLEL